MRVSIEIDRSGGRLTNRRSLVKAIVANGNDRADQEDVERLQKNPEILVEFGDHEFKEAI